MNVPTAADVAAALAEVSDPADAVHLRRFFKTGPGQYGEGDVFIGVRVPANRVVAKRFTDLSAAEIEILLDSEIHEHRLVGLFILRAQFDRAGKQRAGVVHDQVARDDVVQRYLAAVYRGRVNNWDLVDSSADQILGQWLLDQPRDLLFELIASESLWERRVGVLASYAFIRAGDASATLQLAPLLLEDPHDLMHKAVGWMLREVGKRVDRQLLLGSLAEYAPRMPRTMLSYSIEHLEPEQRAYFRSLR